MRNFLFLLVFISSMKASAQNTDIWLFQVESRDGKPMLKNGKNIISRKGYDNQPFFSKDNTVYFTSRRDSVQTDIYKYHIATRKTSRVTFTPKTSEFSPSLSATGFLSVVMVEEDSSQRIWDFPLKGSAKPKSSFPTHDSIGYYTRHGNSAIVYILGGKSNPNRLSIIETGGWEKPFAFGVGRGFHSDQIHTRPAEHGYDLYWSEWLRPSNAARKLVRTPGRSQDLAVYNDYVLMGWESTVYISKMSVEKQYIHKMEEFQPLIDLENAGLKKITRIAVSPDKKWIAIVAEDQ